MKNIKVIYENGDEDLTRIDGTEAEIRAYYIGRVFNLGDIRDKLVKAVDVVFLDKETQPTKHRAGAVISGRTEENE